MRARIFATISILTLILAFGCSDDGDTPADIGAGDQAVADMKTGTDGTSTEGPLPDMAKVDAKVDAKVTPDMMLPDKMLPDMMLPDKMLPDTFSPSCACLISGKCYAKGAADPTVCKYCDPVTTYTSWTPNPNICTIGGVCYTDKEKDVLGCFHCDISKSKTAWTAIPNLCMIGGKCYSKGALNPGGCGSCDPTKSASAWTIAAGSCYINSTCYKDGVKDATGCKVCDTKTSTSAWTAVKNVCLISGKCYANGAQDPTKCGKCDPTSSATAWTISGNVCLIGGKCYLANQTGASACDICTPATSKTAWSVATGTCTINKKCYAKAAKHSGGCATCDPTTSTSAWTIPGVTHCLINDTCYAANKVVGCGKCVPATSKTSWQKVTPCTSLNLDVGTHAKIYSATSYSRGFWFKAPVAFTITGLRVPAIVGSSYSQNVQLVRFATGTVTPSSSSTFTSLFYKAGVAGTSFIPCSISIKKDDLIGIVGSRGTSPLYNSYRAAGAYTSKINNSPVVLTRLYYQTNLSTTQATSGKLVSEPTGAIGRIEVEYTP